MNDNCQSFGLFIDENIDPRPVTATLCRSGYYVMLLKGASEECETKYGRCYCDYNEGSLLCYCPGSVLQSVPTACCRLFAFHPALFSGICEELRFTGYTFFSYAPKEALHPSSEERNILISCIDGIRRELFHSPDRYKHTILIRQITCLLDQTVRFYERQFITREQVNKKLIAHYETYVSEHVVSEKYMMRGSLSTTRCAERLQLSNAYFEDLLKYGLGRTHSCYLQLMQMEAAKRKLHSTDIRLARLVDELGFPSVSYFCLVFRKLTGYTPEEYRVIN